MGLRLGKPEALPHNHLCEANDSLVDPLLQQSPFPIHDDLKCYSYCELKIATRNFSSHNLLGMGNYGSVFKGWLDDKTLAPFEPGMGIQVAVKKFTPSRFGPHRDWTPGTKYLAQLQHTNLVRLIGHCIDSENRFLVYEFMSRGSLVNHLFKRAEVMLWSIRMRIAIDVARGLSFLHGLGENVVYCEDFKTANILLDYDFNAKLSDFGHTNLSNYAYDRSPESTFVMSPNSAFHSPEVMMRGIFKDAEYMFNSL
ncbi:unnamed protein product [Cuscuta epithymum]|uniref:Protein kinase domain-containing protein n=1 Tax=Cuscuta epithymum TaxID=186058 RepID=A0AAV0FNJ2_9ASTE|nr:unnamed protein product [Cuscuta epithymum]CAH9137163.1 unnamed protein product [Cuscuta epithymum]